MSSENPVPDEAGVQTKPEPGAGLSKYAERLSSLLPQLGAWLTVGFIGLFAVGIIWLIGKGVMGQNSIVPHLADVDYARGLITFIFSIGTMGIALLLTIGALVGSHTQEVFTKAKEILTALLAIFGTILGFYFGTSSSGGNSIPLTISPPSIQVAADGKSSTLRAYVAGGEPPYVYSIDFPGDAGDVKSKTTKDGWIVETIDTTKLTPPPVGYKIMVTDNKKRAAEYEAKENERIGPIAPLAPSAPPTPPSDAASPGARGDTARPR